jgi:DNA-directed RNA polymerase subunit RPC12/RpoP
MYVVCKTCGKKFSVFPPSGDLNLGGQHVHLGSDSVEVNRLSFGAGGGISFGPGGRIVFKNTPLPRYRCSHCNNEHEYSNIDIKND